MTITADEYEAQVSAAIVAMVCNCALWQAECQGSVAEARSQTVEDWGGDDSLNLDGTPVDLTHSWLTVRTQGYRETPIAYQTVSRSGPALVVLHLRAVDGDMPAEIFRRAKNLVSGLCRQLRAQLGQPGCLLYATFDPDSTALLEVGSAGNNTPDQLRELEIPINIQWSEIPL